MSKPKILQPTPQTSKKNFVHNTADMLDNIHIEGDVLSQILTAFRDKLSLKSVDKSYDA